MMVRMHAASAPESVTAALAGDPRIVAAILFGSFARAQERPDSDLDVVIVCVDDAARASIEREWIALIGRLGLASGREVHLVDLEEVDCAFRRRIFASGKTLFDRGGDRLKRLLAATLIEYFDLEYARRVIDDVHRRKLGVA